MFFLLSRASGIYLYSALPSRRLNSLCKHTGLYLLHAFQLKISIGVIGYAHPVGIAYAHTHTVVSSIIVHLVNFLINATLKRYICLSLDLVYENLSTLKLRPVVLSSINAPVLSAIVDLECDCENKTVGVVAM